MILAGAAHPLPENRVDRPEIGLRDPAELFEEALLDAGEPGWGVGCEEVPDRIRALEVDRQEVGMLAVVQLAAQALRHAGRGQDSRQGRDGIFEALLPGGPGSDLAPGNSEGVREI